SSRRTGPPWRRALANGTERRSEWGGIVGPLEHRCEGGTSRHTGRAEGSNDFGWPHFDHVERRVDGAERAAYRARKPAALRGLCRRQTYALVHGAQREHGVARARA